MLISIRGGFCATRFASAASRRCDLPFYQDNQNQDRRRGAVPGAECANAQLTHCPCDTIFNSRDGNSMQSEKSNPVLTHPLEIRLMRYALAGGAILAAPAAHATIVYSGPLDTVADAGQNIDVSFNPLASGVTNFTIEVSTTQIDVTGILSSVFFDIGPLAAGTPITVADVTSNPLLVLVNKLNFATHVGPWVGVS